MLAASKLDGRVERSVCEDNQRVTERLAAERMLQPPQIV